MEHLMMISTAVDLGAVALLAWLLLRGRQEREASQGVRQATLESLRADLAQLVLEAERRAQGLEEMLAAREQRLRALLEDMDRAETRQEMAGAKRRSARPRDEREAQPRRDPDPAEARLLRDLHLSFGAREA